jgi:RNA polymerase sigma-70 factor (ECF subfamily)
LKILSDRFEKIYEQTFNELFDGLHRYAMTLVKDEEVASDVIQSVFTKWWEMQRELESADTAKAYLYTAVYRQCLNALRNEKTKVMHLDAYRSELTTSVNSFYDEYAFTELDDKVRSSIEQLPPQCRTIFQKSRFEQKRYTEIADEMDLSVKTVEAQMGKALKILRARLKEYT